MIHNAVNSLSILIDVGMGQALKDSRLLELCWQAGRLNLLDVLKSNSWDITPPESIFRNMVERPGNLESFAYMVDKGVIMDRSIIFSQKSSTVIVEWVVKSGILPGPEKNLALFLAYNSFPCLESLIEYGTFDNDPIIETPEFYEAVKNNFDTRHEFLRFFDRIVVNSRPAYKWIPNWRMNPGDQSRQYSDDSSNDGHDD